MTSDQTVSVRPESVQDFDTIRTIVDTAFGEEPVEVLVDRIRASSQYIPELALVAEVDGTIVGHVMVSTAILRHPVGEPSVIAMLSPLAVDPAWQNKGIGAVLVKSVASATAAAGYSFVVLEGSPVYYRRLGFEPAADYGITLPIPDWAPTEAAQLLPLAGFDAAAVGGGGEVVYPATFDGLD